jgi:hypothetical protein
MTSFSKGPWRESAAADGTIEAQNEDSFVTVCVVGDPFAEMTDTDRANLSLIRAAPEMHEALIAAETMLMVLADTTTNANGTRPTMTTKRALAKVRFALGCASGANLEPTEDCGIVPQTGALDNFRDGAPR